MSGGARVRAESWSWFEATANDDYTFVGATLRAALAQQRGSFAWRAELAAPLLLGLPDDAIAPAPQGQLGFGAAYFAANDAEENVARVFLKQAFVRFGAAPGRDGHALRLGRFELVDGAETTPRDATVAALKRDRIAHRLVGTFGWTHVGRSFDGAHYLFDRRGLNVTAAAFRPTRGAFDADGWDELEVGVGYGALTIPGRSLKHPGELRVFALHYRDYRDAPALVKTDNRPLAARQADREDVVVTTLGAHYLRTLATPAGTFDLLLWGALQRGDWGVQQHRASGFAAELGLQPRVPPLRPWLRIGWNHGSGDDSQLDDDHETFFQVLPTARVYARFPFHNAMNNDDRFASLVLRPSIPLSLRADVHALRLAEERDLWYAGAGAFERETFGFAGRPSGSERDLAILADVSAEARITQRLTGTLYLATVSGGDVIEAIYPDGSSARLGYLEIEYRW